MKLLTVLLLLVSSAYGTEKIPIYHPDSHFKRQASSLQLTDLMGIVVGLDGFMYEGQAITTVRIASITNALKPGRPPDSVDFCGDVKNKIQSRGRSVVIIYSQIMHRKNCYDILKIIGAHDPKF